ncbi:MAG TPA: hypothetical protein VI306_08565 [Pyrinomonadaceae bacterium]
MCDLFQRNTELIVSNRKLNEQIVQTIKSVDIPALEREAQILRQLFAEKFETNFEYRSLIDPAELAEMTSRITWVLSALERHTTKVKTAAANATPVAERADATQASLMTMLGEMQRNHSNMVNDILHDTHFACEMLNENVVEDFYARDLRPIVANLRENISTTLGAENFAAILRPGKDRYFLKAAENSITTANISRVRTELNKVASYLQGIAEMIEAAQRDLEQIAEVPREQAEAVRSGAGTLYVLSCVPWIGLGFAFALLSKVRKFEAAFRSSNEIYQQLGRDIMAKNFTMRRVTLILGGVLGIGGILLFVVLGASESLAVNILVPGSVLGLYLCTAAVLGSVTKQIKEYEVTEAPSIQSIPQPV